MRYKAFGASRFTSGTTPTTFRYTGQREESSLGLYYYGARWYDPALGHFVQPDTIVPNAGNALDYQRYGYARFNPLKYNDPSGHSCNMLETMGFDSVGFLVDCSIGGGGGISRGATGALGAAGGLGAAAALNAGLATGAPPMQAESPAPLLESVPGQVAGAASTSFPLADGGPATSIPASTGVFNNTLNVLADPLPVVEPTGHVYAANTGFIDPAEVRFSQDSVNYRFKDGGTVDDLANGLRNGSVSPQSVPAIRLVEKDGALYTLDNRRLEAFRRAGVNVPFRMATGDEIEKEKWKFTTQNNGDSVRVRGPR